MDLFGKKRDAEIEALKQAIRQLQMWAVTVSEKMKCEPPILNIGGGPPPPKGP